MMRYEPEFTEHTAVRPGQLRQFMVDTERVRCMVVIAVFPYPDGISDVIIDGKRCTYSSWLIEKWWRVIVDV